MEREGKGLGVRGWGRGLVVVAMLLAPSAHAGNLGFKLELEVPVLDGALTGSQNFFYLSYPLWNGLPDVADEGHAPFRSPCASLAVDGAFEFTPDGVITLADVLCDTWTLIPTLTGSELASVQYIEPSDCSWVATILSIAPAWGVVLGGAMGVELETIRDSGLLLQITQSRPGVNRPVLVGSHDPSYAGYEFADPATCPRTILSPHYHSLYQSSTEIFCGLEGVDWLDRDADGNPDTCDGGIWDGSTLFSLQHYRNEPGDIGFRATVINAFGPSVFVVNPIALRPGHGYLLQVEPTSAPRTFIQPHF